MIRLILFVVVGLLAGLGAGTGFAVLKAKSAFVADSSRQKVVADSLAAHEEGGQPKTAAHTPAPNGETTTEAAAHTEPSAAETTPKNTAPPKGEEHSAKVGETPKSTAPTYSDPAVSKSAPAAGEAEHVAPTASAATRVPVPNTAAKPEDIVTPKRISKIFAAMPARDAAKVLVQMDDADVHLILDALGEKQAAAILQNFPAERAATISKNAIRGNRAP